MTETVISFYQKPKLRSQRHPVKGMFLGVVGNPQEEYGSDGRVLLKRVSRQKTIAIKTRSRNFSIDLLVNEALQGDMWQNFISDGMNVGSLLDQLATVYDLDEFIAERMVLSYVSYTKSQEKKLSI